MQTYYALEGQTIYDVCLNTYQTLDQLYKLVNDNSFGSVDNMVISGSAFVWDDTLVLNGQQQSTNAAQGVNYATEILNYDGNGNNFIIADMGKYSQTYNASFLSNADGTTVIVPTDDNGNTLIGCTIVQIEHEIKPYTSSDFSFDPQTGTLTLLNGNTCDKGQLLSIIYSKIINY